MISWIAGLSSSCKSTIAQGIANHFSQNKGLTQLLIDGDSLREELCKNLGFSASDRSENIRRAAATTVMAAMSGDNQHLLSDLASTKRAGSHPPCIVSVGSFSETAKSRRARACGRGASVLRCSVSPVFQPLFDMQSAPHPATFKGNFRRLLKSASRKDPLRRTSAT